MSLVPGARLGPYEVVASLGAGGMGEVYRARDTKLGREVALKVLPAAFSADPERVARFAREARVLASLNHSHIGAIYGFEDEGAVTAIVLELVEGDTLADRLRGRPLPLDEAVGIAAQIAEALEAAHEAGVVHRDLKPSNIKITPAGVVKVLDFGLAKALPADPLDDPSHLPTTIAATREGAILGTVPYMSPEQARGQSVDKRTDIWAFGCVLFEMLTGGSPFSRATLSDTLAAVLERDPDWGSLPAAHPSGLAELLRRCLEKDQKVRLRDIGEATIRLKSLREPAGGAHGTRNVLLMVGVALVVIAAGAFAWWRPSSSAVDGNATAIQSLAVLPLTALTQNDGEAHVGLGIADSIILGLSRARELTVRPTSSIRRYATGGSDALQAAMDLDVDAVLEGTWQRSGDTFRVNLRLLNTSDGRSLWSDSLDVRAGDIFALQDQVAARIMGRLQLEVLPPPARGARRPPSAEAHDLFTQGLLAFTDRGFTAADRRNSDLATSLFERAVRADPGYAEAHAMLGFAYAWTAIFIEENASLVDKAEAETNLAERLDPGQGQVHLNRAFITWSSYRGWRIVEGVREVRRAIELTPTLADLELGSLYYHLGLFDEWKRSNESIIANNPTDLRSRRVYVNEYFLVNMAEEGLLAQRRLLGLEQPDERYYVATRDVRQARSRLDEAKARGGVQGFLTEAKVLALEGRHAEAQRLVTDTLAHAARNRSYHHLTHAAAQVFAVGGKSAEAARWLRETFDNGFPCYPAFAGDPFLDPVRDTPVMKTVLENLRVVWEGYRDQIAAPR